MSRSALDPIDLALRGTRHKLLVALFTSVVLALTAVDAFNRKNIYTVQSKIVLQSSAIGLGSLASLASLAGVDVSSASSKSGDASLYVEDLLGSNDFEEAILDHSWKASKEVADTSKAFLLSDFWESRPDTTKPNWKAIEREGLLKRLDEGGYISVSKDKKTGVVTLVTEFEDPRLTYDINQFLIQELNNTLVTRLNSKARANRQFVQVRLGEVKADLAESENELLHFRQNNRSRVDPLYQLEEGRFQRDLQINQEIYLQLTKQFEMAKIDEEKDVPVLDIIDSPMVPAKKSRPRRSFILFGGLVAGALISLVGAGLFDLYKEDPKRFWSNFRMSSVPA